MALHGLVWCLSVIIRVVILEAIFSKLLRNGCIKISGHVCLGHGNANVVFQTALKCMLDDYL